MLVHALGASAGAGGLDQGAAAATTSTVPVRSGKGTLPATAGTHHFGHTQQGTGEWTITGGGIDGVAGGRTDDKILHDMSESDVGGDLVKADWRRAKSGFNVNDALPGNDDVLGDMPLVDNAGGGMVFLDSRVKLEKI